MRRTSVILAPALLLLVITACSGGVAAPAGDGGPATSLVAVPDAATPTGSADPSDTPEPSGPSDTASASAAEAAPSFALADSDGRIAIVHPDGAARELRDSGWDRRLSLDGTYAVSTALVGPGDTKVAWDAVPAGAVLGATLLPGADMEASATQVGGHLTAFVDRAPAPVEGAIAGAKADTTITLASPDRGIVESYELTGNFVPEAIGSTLRTDGVPAQLFLLEYLPADAPTRYRVRVLDTDTGELGLPLNLRDKLGPRVDQQMAGVTRGQVLASELGLLFTLYRGTSDMPHGHPYAFVHTLDLFDGVWCLEIPAAMRLEELPGALAVAGDRLYVASANGTVGAYDISAIAHPQGSVDMLWVVQLGPVGGREQPAIAAGPDGAVVAFPAMSGLFHVGPDGTVHDPTVFDDGTEAIAVAGVRTYAVGDTWMLPGERPDWLGEVTRLVALS